MFISPNSIFDERYEILSVLGLGGMGSVYKARQINLDRIVAIKVLVNWDPSAESQARMAREALSLSRLHHPSIINVYGYGVYQGSPYLCMEYVEGETLLSRLASVGALPVEQTLEIIAAACDALEYAHARGIIHRDLKPENIMLVEKPVAQKLESVVVEALQVSSPGVPIVESAAAVTANKSEDSIGETDSHWTGVKLIDLGLASIRPDANSKEMEKLTQSGLVLGTPVYMSPEVCQGQQADARSDIYSIGVVLQYCLTGSLPFAGENHMHVMQAQLHKAPPLLAILNPSADLVGLQSVVYKALAKLPEDRYQTAAEMAADLRLVAAGGGQSITTVHKLEALVSRPDRFSMPDSTQRKNVRSNLVLAALIMVFGLITVSVSVVSRTKSEDSLGIYLRAAKALKSSKTDNDKAVAMDLLQSSIEKSEQDHAMNRDTVPRELVEQLLFYRLEHSDERAAAPFEHWVDINKRERRHLRDDDLTNVARHAVDAKAWNILLKGSERYPGGFSHLLTLDLIRKLPQEKMDGSTLAIVLQYRGTKHPMPDCDLTPVDFGLFRYYEVLGDNPKALAYLKTSLGECNDHPDGRGILLEYCEPCMRFGLWREMLDCALRGEKAALSDGAFLGYASELVAYENLNEHRKAMGAFDKFRRQAETEHRKAYANLLSEACVSMEAHGHGSDAALIRKTLERNK